MSGIYVNTNVGGLRGRNQLNNVNNQLNNTYQRLSSGLRVNSAKDDAAGLAISDRMTSQINGLTQANRNIADGIALCQTMEGGLEEISSMAQKLRALAVQAANGTNTEEDRKALDAEATALSLEITRTAEHTTFGGKSVLNGSCDDSLFTEGDTYNDGNKQIQRASPSAGGAATKAFTSGKISIQLGANGGDALELEMMAATFSAACANLDKVVVKKGKVNTPTTTPADKFSSLGGKGSKQDASGKWVLDLSTAADAEAALGICDTMIKNISAQRGQLGAAMNRMDSTIRNQSNVIANQSDARSRIRDTDFAEESAKLSQQNIIQQASMSMLMQANARPQMALSLLG